MVSLIHNRLQECHLGRYYCQWTRLCPEQCAKRTFLSDDVDESSHSHAGQHVSSLLLDPFCLTNIPRFMESLAFVDKTYYAKHQGEDASTLRETYYPNLRKYKTHGGSTHTTSTHTTSTAEAISMFLFRYGKKAGISLAVFALSYVPYIGRLVLPAASFYTFHKVAGLGPAAIVFGTGIFLPKRYLVLFLQSYFSSRSLMRELVSGLVVCCCIANILQLEPYFSRIKFTKEQKKHWFHDREGLLFGFGVGFYIFARIPLLGVLIYGIAEASTAYLITKITDPPPPPAESANFAASQQQWTNKHEFLSLKLLDLDIPKSSTQDETIQSTVDAQGSSSAIPSGPPPPYSEMRPR